MSFFAALAPLGKRRFQQVPDRDEPGNIEPCTTSPASEVDAFDPDSMHGETVTSPGVVSGGLFATENQSGWRGRAPSPPPAAAAITRKEVAEVKRARRGPKADAEQAVGAFIARQPDYQRLTPHIHQQMLDMIVKFGLQFQGRALESFLFADGPMLDFCRNIARFNGTNLAPVKRSKLKMLKTLANECDEYFFCDACCDPSDLSVRDIGNITLTKRGKHNLLMHIDTDEEGMSHKLESLCRDQTSDVLSKLFEFSRKLPEQVKIANLCMDKKKLAHEKSKEQMREQRKVMVERGQCTDEKKAQNMLRGATQFLNRGLFPEIKTSDGAVAKHKDGTPKTRPAIEMAVLANPGKSKQQIYNRGVTSYANEPVHHAMELQRSAVTFRMKSMGMSYLEAHKVVGQSQGIKLAALFGLDEDDPNFVQTLAEICFNQAKGIECFGDQMQQQQEVEEQSAVQAFPPQALRM